MYKRSSQPEMGSELYTAINNSTSTNGNLRSNKSIRPDLQARTAFSENSKVTHIANKIAAYKLDGRTELGTLNISIENKAGSYRHWYDPHNKKAGKTLQKYDYGYIRGSKGMDGDHVDCYVGPDRTAKNVYVVTTNKAPDFSREDEQKCMLGFGSEAEAKKAFLDHYDNPKFFRAIKSVPFKEFEKKVLATKDSATKKVAFATRRKTAAERDLEEGMVYERPRGLARNSYSRIAPSGDFKNIRGQMDEMFGYMDDDRSTGVME